MKFFRMSTSVIDKSPSPILTAYYKSPVSKASIKLSIEFFKGPIPEKINFKVCLEEINLGATANNSLAPILFISAPTYRMVSSSSFQGIHDSGNCFRLG